MDRRPQLHQLLKAMLEPEHSGNVYFQPPSDEVMKYPCIVYKRDNLDTKSANNKPYMQTDRWLVTSIDRSPSSKVPFKIRSLPMSAFSRSFVTSGLNHTAYTLYF